MDIPKLPDSKKLYMYLCLECGMEFLSTVDNKNHTCPVGHNASKVIYFGELTKQNEGVRNAYFQVFATNAGKDIGNPISVSKQGEDTCNWKD